MIQIKIQKTGSWLKYKYPKEISYMCSECGQRLVTEGIRHYKYCFNCGAKMKGE